MERIQEILKKYMGNACESYSQEEMEKFKADSFNESEGSLNESDGYNCTVCKNKGMILRAAQTSNGSWTTISRDCKCMTVRRTIMRMERSGLKNIIRDYTFGKFDAADDWQKVIKEAAVAYAKNPEGWFFVGGQSGAGKTHICTAICRELLMDGKSVKYMLWRDDVVKLKNAVTDYEEYSRSIQQYKSVDVLYIDDLFKTGKSDKGPQAPTAADVNAAFEILNFRYSNPKLITIISSECTINDILDIDEAVGGRIIERTKRPFSIKGDKSKNYRLKGATEL